MFTHLKDILPKTVNQLGLRRQFDAAHVCQLYRRVIGGILKGADQFSSPKSFKNGTLYVYVKNSAYAQQVFMKRKQILTEINKNLGVDLIKELRTEVNINF